MLKSFVEANVLSCTGSDYDPGDNWLRYVDVLRTHGSNGMRALGTVAFTAVQASEHRYIADVVGYMDGAQPPLTDNEQQLFMDGVMQASTTVGALLLVVQEQNQGVDHV